MLARHLRCGELVFMRDGWVGGWGDQPHNKASLVQQLHELEGMHTHLVLTPMPCYRVADALLCVVDEVALKDFFGERDAFRSHCAATPYHGLARWCPPATSQACSCDRLQLPSEPSQVPCSIWNLS